MAFQTEAQAPSAGRVFHQSGMNLKLNTIVFTDLQDKAQLFPFVDSYFFDWAITFI